VPAVDLFPTPPTAHRLAFALVALLALDIVLSWLALQAALVFVNVLWHGAGGYEVRSLLQAHARQFATLRSLQLLAWLATAGVLVAWLRRLRASRTGPGGPRLGYATRRGIMVALGGLLVVAIGADLMARLLALRSGSPLDLGPSMQLLVLGHGAAIAGAALAVAVVLGVDRRCGEAARPRGPTDA
jgi:hypothetical protein